MIVNAGSTYLGSPRIAIVVQDPHETQWIVELYKVCNTQGFCLDKTGPIPSYPCLNIPHPQSIFFDSSLELMTAIEWFSPQETFFTFIPENTSSFVGVPISREVSNCLFDQAVRFILNFSNSYHELSIPSYPRSFIPQA